ncbi:hypothetical protein PLICRDRAFT_47160 [Plicaturopsis crispa FD-325 SS-3]|uniref:non-specific serine/threonine protein kinase n=1 Tax=Plicaturopsis crispa FD-325 SS-3 TaxID=944288 RepID=A0A0C9SWG1_PLICR|nr:hypothetical protein PLICRDRAFT_47160 [Plicaturopsis crispa FD-325 SS-3]
MEPPTSLQIPESPFAGPSRQQNGASRPVSVNVQPTASSSSSAQPASRKQRASHQVVSSQQQQQQQLDDQPAYRDVYSHPAAVAYAAAHPRRQIPKFGPYLLLQTLGEGEFGKVKLGLHNQWGEEVAVKLIRRGNIDTTVRMSKVEREIEVLRTLKHPNIVRLYDVIETDKYIGIILEYASGGELFDHILAHRYLKEKDASKLFAQLISGVWYIHQKKIVHRDLKLENLLLDRHRNVIITDFGFANRFEHRSDDLMQTSCGSPCYAAPELVISEGLYVGSAVDIWSCGVILYAMLAGYLPFDDDPANPDGDNINLLYKYIVNTPLSFPDYISDEARDLLSIMLVPDPTQRADLEAVMDHTWLKPWAHTFRREVDELEKAAMEQHQLKRLAYQRQMKQAAAAAAETNNKVTRSQSTRPELFTAHGGGSTRNRSYNQGQPEYLYETSADQSGYSTTGTANQSASSRKGYTSQIVLPTSQALDDDPFAPTPSREVPDISLPIPSPEKASPADSRSRRDDTSHRPSSKKGSVPPPTAIPQPKSTPHSQKKSDGFRHTIQVEYEADSPERGPSSSQSPPRSSASRREATETAPRSEEKVRPRERSASQTGATGSVNGRTSRRPSVDTTSLVKPLPAAPSASPQRTRADRAQAPSLSPTVMRNAQQQPPTVAVTGPATPQQVTQEEKAMYPQAGNDTMRTNSTRSSRHRKGLSVDKLGLGKIFGTPNADQQANGAPSRVPSDSSAGGASVASDNSNVTGHVSKRPSTLQAQPSPSHNESSKSSLLTPESNGKKSRRNTLTVMVERGFKPRSAKAKNAASAETKEKETPPVIPVPPKSAVQPSAPPTSFRNPNGSRTDVDIGLGMPASTSKARKVMQWFRSKSKGPEELTDEPEEIDDFGREKPQPSATPIADEFRPKAALPGAVIPPASPVGIPSTVSRGQGHPQRTPSTATDNSFSQRVKRTVGVVVPTPAKNVLRVHHGAVDQTTITTRAPPEVMQHVREVLEDMGVSIQLESEYKYRCIRSKRRRSATIGLGGRDAAGTGNGLAAFTLHGTAASNGVDKRGLPAPSHPSFTATGGMLRGLLMRRQSSQVSTGMGGTSQPSFDIDDSVADVGPVLEPSSAHEAVYGDPAQDAGDEVRFSVELTRLDRLNDTYSLDIRRLKGNLRSYKFLYDTLRERAALQ